MRAVGGHGLSVRVKAVDSELDFGEDATGGIQLTTVEGRLYHLRTCESGPVLVGR